jgi:glycosyltransferase involved in cell wall biosynthesis
MNIVYVLNDYYPFGMAATMRVKLFSEYLVNNGNNVHILISNQNNGDNPHSGIENRVHYSTLSKIRMPKAVMYLIYPLLVLFKLILLKNKKEINVLNVYSGLTLFNLNFIFFGKLMGYRVIIDAVEDQSKSTENITRLGKIDILASQLILPHLGKLIDGFTVISYSLMKKYKLLFNKHPIEILPICAANINFQSEEKIDIKLKCLYAGSFGQKDGIYYLINAFEKVLLKYSDVELHLVGRADEIFLKKINNNNNIKYFGYLDELEYWQKLSEADILLMTRVDSPYANAGFPFKLGEYLATKRPVICTNTTDVGYYLIDCVDCVMAKPSDEKSLVNSLLFLIENPKEREKIGLNGYKKCIEFFNPEINGKALFNFIKNL